MVRESVGGWYAAQRAARPAIQERTEKQAPSTGARTPELGMSHLGKLGFMGLLELRLTHLRERRFLRLVVLPTLAGVLVLVEHEHVFGARLDASRTGQVPNTGAAHLDGERAVLAAIRNRDLGAHAAFSLSHEASTRPMLVCR
jgi:hypothetical protein